MKKGEIWFVEIPSSDGHEQAGIHPVIIMAESEANIYSQQIIIEQIVCCS